MPTRWMHLTDDELLLIAEIDEEAMREVMHRLTHEVYLYLSCW